MTGTFINVIAILVGSGLGVLFGSHLSDRLKSTALSGMGIFTAAVGMQMFMKTENSLVVLGALILGTVLGEWLRNLFKDIHAEPLPEFHHSSKSGRP